MKCSEGIRAMKGQPDEPCCSCCTPTAEAFELALEEFSLHAVSDFRIAFVITDGGRFKFCCVESIYTHELTTLVSSSKQQR